jgi:hypothetical protein
MLEQTGFNVLSASSRFLISEPVIILTAEKAVPPTVQMKAALAELARLRGL